MAELDLQRINISKSITPDPIEKSLSLRYEEILALRMAVRRASSKLATKRPRPNGTKRMQANGK